ncbi:MAG: hypothetical protein HOW73_44885 [Polyangiaceae bacterium]|nr:hypothetical protein [Polyangiaceae bacterium]
MHRPLLLFVPALFLLACQSETASMCEEGDGAWVEEDACYGALFNCVTQHQCLHAIGPGCDCGEGSCWDGEQCVPVGQSD